MASKVVVLKISDIMRIAEVVHNRYFKDNNGVPIFDGAAIQRRLVEDVDLPVIIMHNGKTMWIDRQYVAISNVKSKSIKYLYITKEFVREEMHSMRETRHRLKGRTDTRSRKLMQWAVDMLAEYKAYFNVMKASEQDYLLSKTIKGIKSNVTIEIAV